MRTDHAGAVPRTPSTGPGAPGRSAAPGIAPRPALWRALAACAVLLAASGGPSAVAAAPVPAIGVVDFYAITPVPPVSGLTPELFASDDLSRMLAQSSGGRFEVIPRAAVQQAERGLRWRDGDVLKYDRLAELARRLQADRLVVGWIRELVNSSAGSDGDFPRVGDGPIMGSAEVIVQVFDARQGRVVAQARGEGDAIGMVRLVITEQVLHRALAPTIGAISSSLAAP